MTDTKKPKQLKLHMNFLQGIFKPMLSNKLQVSGLCVVNFKIDCLAGTFELEGTGIKKSDGSFGTSKCVPMKISDNTEYKTLCDKNIFKNVPDCVEWYLSYITIDFVQKFVRTEVWYKKSDGRKNKKEFKNSF